MFGSLHDFFQLMNNKMLTANQNECEFKGVAHLKWETVERILSIGVDWSIGR